MTLTETAYYTRKTIKYSIFFLIFLIIARISWEVGTSVYRKFFPPPPPPPSVRFGKLTKLPFTDKKDSSGFTYALQTPTGEFPAFQPILDVYFMPRRSASFLDLDEATKIAQSLEFTGNITNLSETVYRFESRDKPASIDMNIVNKTFSLNYNLTKNPETLNYRPRQTDDAMRAVTSFLSRSGLLTDDLSSGEKKFDFLRAEEGQLVLAASLSEANFVRVNFFRAKYNDLPVLTPNRKISSVWFLVGADRFAGAVLIAGEYHYFAVDQNQSSTYPVKTGQEAWEELKNGRGFIISAPEGVKDITIRKIYLAYYDSGETQGFLQPIIVFEGDNDFVAYLPAITDEYYGGD